MAIATDPHSGIQSGWADGDDNWGSAMNANLRLISRFGFHLTALSATTATPPTTPADGDTYIIPTGATDGWAAYAGQIAYYDGSAWSYLAPKKGYSANVVNGAGFDVYRYSGTAWVKESAAAGSPTKPSIIAVTASRNLAATDASNYLRSTSATAVTLTIPAGMFAAGDIVSGVRIGAGAVTIAGASGVTLNVPAGHTAVARAAGSAWSIICVAVNEFDLTGDLGVTP